jgi:hypothetical protein
LQCEGHERECALEALEIRGINENDARARAQHIVGEALRKARRPVRQHPVVWVARLSGDPVSSLRFLEEAESRLRDEQFDMAVVAAQIHLEVQVRVLLEAAAEHTSNEGLHAVISQRPGWGPHNPRTGPIIEALFTSALADCPAWREYRAHVDRRNAVVHMGQAIDAESARASLEAVSSLWLWLNAAASDALGSG